MSVSVLYSRALAGISAPEVRVEVHLAGGMPMFTIVGLPDTEVREARDRVRAAIQNAHFQFPARRVTVNLAPAELPKESGRYDLPIALGILASSGQIPKRLLDQYEFAGELSLTGELRPIRGALVMMLNATRPFILPTASAEEAVLAERAQVFPANSLLEVCAHLSGSTTIAPYQGAPPRMRPHYLDFADVKGQIQVKRAFEVAAAGRHSILLMGPPGTGKSMLAQRLPGILPPLSRDEAIESAAILSIAGRFRSDMYGVRQVRSPHHSASGAALVGGGATPRPGEISLAHQGVLFLDELLEFDRKVLEALREPLETGHITVSRANRQTDFPASFQLVAAMNPCPCGFQGHTRKRCRCSEEQIRRYRSRLSGPLLDRIDIQAVVPNIPEKELLNKASGEDSATIRARVEAAVERQIKRQGKPNSALLPKEIDTWCRPSDAQGEQTIRVAIEKLNLSARSYHRILKVARTIADLEGNSDIQVAHLAEGIQYRRGIDAESLSV